MLMTIAVISLSQKRLILAALRKDHTNIKGTGQRGFYHGSPVSKKPLPDRLPLFLALMGPYFWRLEKEGKKGKQDKASLNLEFTLSLLLSKYLQYTQHPYWTFGDSSPQQDGGMRNLSSPVLGQKLWWVCPSQRADKPETRRLGCYVLMGTGGEECKTCWENTKPYISLHPTLFLSPRTMPMTSPGDVSAYFGTPLSSQLAYWLGHMPTMLPLPVPKAPVLLNFSFKCLNTIPMEEAQGYLTPLH